MLDIYIIIRFISKETLLRPPKPPCYIHGVTCNGKQDFINNADERFCGMRCLNVATNKYFAQTTTGVRLNK